MDKDLAESQSERTHRTQIDCLSNDLEKIQLAEEIHEEGDTKSQTPADEGEMDMRKLSTVKGKSKQGKLFEKINCLLF